MPNQTLLPLNGYYAFTGPIVTVVLDGVGLGKRDESDGVFMANTPVLDDLLREPLVTSLEAHGSAVGLPSDDDMGNSEVGHNALGAGRIFSQGAKLVTEAIKTRKIFSSRAWREIEKRCAGGATLHVIGLVCDGNVHSILTTCMHFSSRALTVRLKNCEFTVFLMDVTSTRKVRSPILCLWRKSVKSFVY